MRICFTVVGAQALVGEQAAKEVTLLLSVHNLPASMTDFKTTVKSKVKDSGNIAGKTSRLPTNYETLNRFLIRGLNCYNIIGEKLLSAT